MKLSIKQKAEIGKLARAAWTSEAMAGEREAMLERNGELSESAVFTCWRHCEQQKVLGGGRSSLLEAGSEEDFLRLCAHFRALAGDEAGAQSALARHSQEGRVRAFYKLREACEERGLKYPEYPGAICRKQYRCDLGDASERQLWHLFYTVRNRRKPQEAVAA